MRYATHGTLSSFTAVVSAVALLCALLQAAIISQESSAMVGGGVGARLQWLMSARVFLLGQVFMD